MGGDIGPDTVVPAALAALREHQDLDIILVGDEVVLEKSLVRHKAAISERLHIRHASQVVEMDDLPSHAMRNKKDSSMRVAINLVKQGDASACVSAGNTGALMATARFVLKMLPGIDRPAICTALPTMTDHTWMLDLGANVDVDAEHLLQFAVMGSVIAHAVDGNESPRIGLLNIGEEEIKGNDQVRKAAQLLSPSHLNYGGYAEGDDIYKGGFDVIVCDGFVGNVSLKTTEGVAKMIAQFIREEFSRNILTKAAALVTMPVLRAFRRRIDPRRYNGASLLGLRGIVVKSHGSADALAFANAIKVAVLAVRESVPERISSQLQTYLEQRQAI
jgi:glycerol-3-phosphate acyltransferase PlsX